MIFYEIKDWPKVSISFVTREFMETNMFTSKEIYDGSEMYIEMFGTSITDAPWGIVISPFGNGMKFGFRSRLEGVNARLVAEGVCNNEGRGGHNQASGGTFILENKIIDAKEGIEILINWLNNNQPTLIN